MKIIGISLALAFLSASSNAFGQLQSRFDSLVAATDTRIEQALSEYQSFLEGTREERLKLITEINQLENELIQARARERSTRTLASDQGQALTDAQTRINALDSQAQYSLGVLSEYLNGFESRIHISEDQRFADPLRDLRSRLDAISQESALRLPLFFEAIEAGMKRQEELLGGAVFSGRAIEPGGGVKQGTIVLAGPTAYFQSEDGSASGVLNYNPGTIEPRLVPLTAESGAELQALIANGSGTLPLDASLGNALALSVAKGTIGQHIAKGGWVGYAILVLGLLALCAALAKLIDLRRSRVEYAEGLDEIARAAAAGDPEAPAKAKALPGPIASVIATGVIFARADSETLLESMDATIMRYRPKLERFLPFLAITAAVAPLMGLLGTVVGMIKTFTLIEVFGTGDAKSLSSGISEALVTTELGLIVAIPALVLHGIFNRIIRGRIGELEQAASDFARSVAQQKMIAPQ